MKVTDRHGIINQYNLAGDDAEATATHVADSLIAISKNLALDFGQGIQTVVNMDSVLTSLKITMAGSDEQFQEMDSSIQKTAIDLGTSVARVSDAVKTYANEQESVSTILAKTKADIELSNVSSGELSAKEATDAIE